MFGNRFRYGVIALVGCLALSSLAQAQALAKVIEIKAGAAIDLTVRVSSEDVFAGETRKTDGVLRYRQTIAIVADIPRVTQILTGREGTFGDEPADVAALASSLTFDANGQLAGARIVDYPALVGELFDAGPLAKASPEERQEAGLSPGRRRFFDSLSPEHAALALLRVQQLLTTPQNITLKVGEPWRAPTAFMGATGVRQLELKRVDQKADLAFVILTDRLEAKPKPTVTLITTTDCDYAIDMKSGMVATAACTFTRALDAPDLPRKTVYRFEITQAPAK